jgi:hypothetical protein
MMTRRVALRRGAASGADGEERVARQWTEELDLSWKNLNPLSLGGPGEWTVE